MLSGNRVKNIRFAAIEAIEPNIEKNPSLIFLVKLGFIYNIAAKSIMIPASNIGS